MERMLHELQRPSGHRQAFEQLRRFVHQQRRLVHQQEARRIHHQQQISLHHQQEQRNNAVLSENRDGIRLTVDLPGVHPSDVSVSHDPPGVLTIRACRKHYALLDQPDSVYCTKKQKLQRRYAVNTDVVDAERLTATLSRGVLTVRAPKRKASSTAQAQQQQQQRQGQVAVVTHEHEEEHEVSVLTSSTTQRHPNLAGNPANGNLHYNVIESSGSLSG